MGGVIVNFSNGTREFLNYTGESNELSVDDFINLLPNNIQSKVAGVEVDNNNVVNINENGKTEIFVLLNEEATNRKFTYKNVEYIIKNTTTFDGLLLKTTGNEIYTYLINYLYDKTNASKLSCNKLSVKYKDITSIRFTESFKTTSITNMRVLFYACTKLQLLDVSNFDTSNVQTMRSMFNSCLLLEQLDLSSFNTSNVDSIANMFYKCTSLKTVNLSSFDISVDSTSMTNMFKNCNELTKIILNSSIQISDLILHANLPGTESDWSGGAGTGYVFTRTI